MPVARAAFDFDDVCTAVDVVFPVLTVSELPEGLDDLSDHPFEVRLIADCQRQMFEPMLSRTVAVIGEESKAFTNAVVSTNGAYRAEPISAVYRHIERLTAS